MDKGIFATVEHRKLMELKNCGAVDAARLEDLAEVLFLNMKEEIIAVRKLDTKKGFWGRLFNLSMPVEQEVPLMFSTRQELVDHLSEIEVPSLLCPVTEEAKERLVFVHRAAKYAEEAVKILDMFKRHHEVIVDSDRSQVIDWILQNHVRVRTELNKGA
ncbi:hypothetical protein CL97_gp222 [Cronobacter phage CR9]|uniref:Uncharacterized protein n=1 Tax=Cronobacter phage CR9 TaxID=1162290 RepID=M1F2F2_9CAUD|nr:hypothetical protein CL97_gp222 [Cronobacter phage CR9]AFH21106.1 hypothetical protein CR9_222 [Cronobacter phage CR9]